MEWRCNACGTDGRTTSEDSATQLLICEPLSFAMLSGDYNYPVIKSEVDSELPKVLLKVLFWALLKVLLLRKVLFNVLKKVL